MIATKPNIELFNCDWREVLPQYESNWFDLAIVDPPYGIGMSGGNVGYKGNNNFERKDWDRSVPSDDYFYELKRQSKNQIIWGGNYYELSGTRGFIIWDKGAGFKNRTYAECEFAWTSFDCNAKIYKRDPLACRDYIGKIHPTQKPVALYRWLLKNYAKEGDKILDTHLGSGSTAIACYEEGFDLVATEIDEDYFDAMTKRFNEHKSQTKLF